MLMHLSIYICMHSYEAMVSLFTYLNHLYVHGFLCIFVHLSEPFLLITCQHFHLCSTILGGFQI